MVCLHRKVDSVTVSLIHAGMRVTPAKMDTSCCRKRIIMGVKVRMCFFAELPTLVLAYMCCIIKGYTVKKENSNQAYFLFRCFYQ